MTVGRDLMFVCYLALLLCVYVIVGWSHAGAAVVLYRAPKPGTEHYEDYMRLKRANDEFRGVKHYDTYTPYPLKYKPLEGDSNVI